MNTATVTVKYVNPPQAGKKMGNIKTADGAYFSVWPNDLHSFQVDGVYDIEFESRDFNGKMYHTVKRFKPGGGIQPPAPTYVADYQPVSASQVQAPAKVTRAETNAHDAERMFVCSLLNAYVRAGNVQLNPTQLLHAVGMLRSIWNDTFGQDV